MVGEGESFEGAEVGRLRRLSGVVVILMVVGWCVEESCMNPGDSDAATKVGRKARMRL